MPAAHPATIEHLTKFGITAIESMPVHELIHDMHLNREGLRHHRGYSAIGHYAPHNEDAADGEPGQQAVGPMQMVKALRAAGMEVIREVVYHHTSDGNRLGSMLAFKGVDNAAYYRLVVTEPAARGARGLWDRKVELLRAISLPAPEEIRHGTIRGRYAAGRISARKVPLRESPADGDAPVTTPAGKAT